MSTSSLGGRAVSLVAALGLVGSLLAIVAPAALALGPDTVSGTVTATTGETITMTAINTLSGTNPVTGSWKDQGNGFTYQGPVTRLNVEIVNGVATAAACGPLAGYPGVEFVQLVLGPSRSQSYLYPAFFGCPKAPNPGGGYVVSGVWTVVDAD